METLTTCLVACPLPIETLLDGAPLYNGLSDIGPPPPLKSSHRQINYFFRTSQMEHDLSFLSFEIKLFLSARICYRTIGHFQLSEFLSL